MNEKTHHIIHKINHLEPSTLEYIQLVAKETPITNKTETLLEIEDHKPFSNQAVYVINYPKGEIVHQQNIKCLLGYDTNEFSLPLVLEKIYHPKQRTQIKIILNTVIQLGFLNTIKKNTTMSIICKMRKKNGEYITVLRQTGIYEITSTGQMVSNYSIITDITDLYESDKVAWKVNNPSDIYNKERLQLELVKATKSLFTRQELNILKQLCLKKSSKEISDKLNISIHTVNTHRRNMLKKAQAANSLELIEFAKNNLLF